MISQLLRDGFLVGIIPGQPEENVLQAAGALPCLDHPQRIVRKNSAFLHRRGQAEALIHLLLHDAEGFLQNAASVRPVALEQCDGLIRLDTGLYHHRHALTERADPQIIQFLSAHCFTACLMKSVIINV